MYGRERTPNMFCSFFSQNPDFFFTYLLYTFIYYIFGCAARAVDARFPTQRPHGSCYRWEKERKKERKRGRKKKSERNYKEGGASAKMAFISIWMNALSYAIVGPVWPSRLATETCITILLKSYNAM